MRHSEFMTMSGIIDDLDVESVEDVQGFLDDCQQVGAKKTAEYIHRRLQQENDVDTNMLRMHLSEDFSGV